MSSSKQYAPTRLDEGTPELGKAKARHLAAMSINPEASFRLDNPWSEESRSFHIHSPPTARAQKIYISLAEDSPKIGPLAPSTTPPAKASPIDGLTRSAQSLVKGVSGGAETMARFALARLTWIMIAGMSMSIAYQYMYIQKMENCDCVRYY